MRKMDGVVISNQIKYHKSSRKHILLVRKCKKYLVMFHLKKSLALLYNVIRVWSSDMAFFHFGNYNEYVFSFWHAQCLVQNASNA